MILVQGFCPLKIKINQFPDGFHINPFPRWILSFPLMFYDLSDIGSPNYPDMDCPNEIHP